MSAEPRLDRSKPFITVFGEHEYAFKQGNRCFDVLGKFLKYEGDAPKEPESEADAEVALRAKIRAEIEAEMRAEAAAKVKPEEDRPYHHGRAKANQ